MKIFIELPTWLGDSVMASPAIENLVNFFSDTEITLMGSVVSIEALMNNPKVTKTYVLEKNYFNLYKTINQLGEFDLFVSFRDSFRSKFTKFFVSAQKKYQFNKKIYYEGHQVEKFNNFINNSLEINNIASRLILHTEKLAKDRKNKLLGINPGASYGSAKRWYPKDFADVASSLSSHYDIIIFGGPEEKDIAADIEKSLIEKGVNNYQNLAATMNISELILQITNLDLFITGDSGPMHIAAASQIPTVAIFGPTNDKETSQWKNNKSIIIKKNLECQPCMQRMCPLNHNNCMKLITASDVLDAASSLTKL